MPISIADARSVLYSSMSVLYRFYIGSISVLKYTEHSRTTELPFRDKSRGNSACDLAGVSNYPRSLDMNRSAHRERAELIRIDAR